MPYNREGRLLPARSGAGSAARLPAQHHPTSHLHGWQRVPRGAAVREHSPQQLQPSQPGVAGVLQQGLLAVGRKRVPRPVLCLLKHLPRDRVLLAAAGGSQLLGATEGPGSTTRVLAYSQRAAASQAPDTQHWPL